VIALIAVETGSLPTASVSSSLDSQSASFYSTSNSILVRAGKSKFLVSGAFLRAAGIDPDKARTTSTAADLVLSSYLVSLII